MSIPIRHRLVRRCRPGLGLPSAPLWKWPLPSTEKAGNFQGLVGLFGPALCMQAARKLERVSARSLLTIVVRRSGHMTQDKQNGANRSRLHEIVMAPAAHSAHCCRLLLRCCCNCGQSLLWSCFQFDSRRQPWFCARTRGLLDRNSEHQTRL